VIWGNPEAKNNIGLLWPKKLFKKIYYYPPSLHLAMPPMGMNTLDPEDPEGSG